MFEPENTANSSGGSSATSPVPPGTEMEVDTVDTDETVGDRQVLGKRTPAERPDHQLRKSTIIQSIESGDSSRLLDDGKGSLKKLKDRAGAAHALGSGLLNAAARVFTFQPPKQPAPEFSVESAPGNGQLVVPGQTFRFSMGAPPSSKQNQLVRPKLSRERKALNITGAEEPESDEGETTPTQEEFPKGRRSQRLRSQNSQSSIDSRHSNSSNSTTSTREPRLSEKAKGKRRASKRSDSGAEGEGSSKVASEADKDEVPDDDGELTDSDHDQAFPSIPIKPQRGRRKKTERQYRDPTPPPVINSSTAELIAALETMTRTSNLQLEARLLQQIQTQEERHRREREEDRKLLEEQTNKLMTALESRTETQGPPRPSKRKAKQPVLPKEVKDHPARNAFLTHLRDFMDHKLLGYRPVKNVDQDEGEEEDKDDPDSELGPYLHLTFKPLSDNDYDNYCLRGPGAFTFTRDNFRYDFSRRFVDNFNQDASHFVTKTFKTTYDAGEYSRVLHNGLTIPDIFFHRPYLAYTVEQHARYLFRLYREAKEPDAVARREERLQKNVRSVRRNQLFNERRETAYFYPQLRKHTPMIEAAGVDGISEDESEDEEIGGAIRTKYIRLSPEWRSVTLATFLHLLDEYTANRKRSNIGRKRRGRGSQARICEFSDRTYVSNVPKKLPWNCYSRTYLDNLPRWQLDQIERSSKQYIFPTRKDLIQSSNENHDSPNPPPNASANAPPMNADIRKSPTPTPDADPEIEGSSSNARPETRGPSRSGFFGGAWRGTF
ncbi:hypothetical protein MD484_g8985, partial [Candolleomyces efflorescens]